jgi:Mrp family chromosome partitioning ATPase
VILDGPPILAADDASLLVPHADVVVVVVRPMYTRSRQLRQVLDMLYQRKAKEVAIVFNQARADDLAGKYVRNGQANGHRNGKLRPGPKDSNGAGGTPLPAPRSDVESL